MAEPIIKLVTISWDVENGLEVDWDGMSEHEALGLLIKATETVECYMESETFDDD